MVGDIPKLSLCPWQSSSVRHCLVGAFWHVVLKSIAEGDIEIKLKS